VTLGTICICAHLCGDGLLFKLLFAAVALPHFISTSSQHLKMSLRSLLVSTLAVQASAVWLAGVNIAGCEIGIDTSVSDTDFSDTLSTGANKRQQGNFAPNDFEKQYSCPSSAMAKSQMYGTEEYMPT
jgi:hypothetical protein